MKYRKVWRASRTQIPACSNLSDRRTPWTYAAELFAGGIDFVAPTAQQQDGRPCFPEVFMSAYDQDRVARYARLHSNSESTLNVDEDNVEKPTQRDHDERRASRMDQCDRHGRSDREKMQIILQWRAARSLISQLARCVVFLESVAACRDLYPRNTCVCVPADVSEVHVALVDFKPAWYTAKKRCWISPTPHRKPLPPPLAFLTPFEFFQNSCRHSDSDRISCARPQRSLQRAQSNRTRSPVCHRYREAGGQRDRRQRAAGTEGVGTDARQAGGKRDRAATEGVGTDARQPGGQRDRRQRRAGA